MINCYSSGRDKVLILWNISQGSIVRTVPVYEGIEGTFLLPPNGAGFITSHQSHGIYVAAAGEKGTCIPMLKDSTIYPWDDNVFAIL